MDRPSTWIGALGLSVFAACAYGLVMVLAGQSPNGWHMLMWAGAGAGASLFSDFAMWAVKDWRQAAVKLEADRAGTEETRVKTQATRLALEGATVGGDEAVIIPSPEPLDLTRAAMKQALNRFFRGGDQAGSFSIRALSSIVSDGDWAALTEFYCSDAGGRVLRDRGGPLGTGWGYGWTLDTVLQALNTNRLPFPDMAVPDVALYVANTAQRNTKRRSSTVVEGTVIGGKG